MRPKRLKMVIQYAGSAYVGWERQKNGLAIQQVLEEGIRKITGEEVSLEGSGRTDAGVHALAQVASFWLTKPIHPLKLRLGINAVIPQDVSVLSLEEVPKEFHARKSAKSKWYRYTILNTRSRQPLLLARALHVPQPLDIGPMQRAAVCLVGSHDFKAFAKEAHLKKSCRRTILRAEVVEERPFIHLDVEGQGFLYNMVRIIAGTLIEIGRGRRSSEDVRRLLAGGTRADAGYTAPACGLVLMAVRY